MAAVDEILLQLTSQFAAHEEVGAVLLAGSRAIQFADKNSDIDLYIYGETMLPLEKRKSLLRNFSDHMEYNNQYWETGDEGYLRDTNTAVDIMYRNLNWIRGEMERVVFQHQASLGYTTCIWFNVLNSRILFDRNGALAALQKKVSIPYPQALKRNIIRKNYPLLRDSMCSYYHQIEKAIRRIDLISVNHRSAAFFQSYFDILFAVNSMLHPGEKRLVKIIADECHLKPVNFELDVNNIIARLNSTDSKILPALDALIDHLDQLLEEQNLRPTEPK
ncbi:MAG: DUF4037 domain-containing protein [Candidatus Zhuqueibacterota bacterium]